MDFGKGHISYEEHVSTATFLKERLANGFVPDFVIVCGSGLGMLIDDVEGPRVEIPYDEIPGFKCSTVAGHEGKLVFGMINGKKVVCMKGRLHAYEGYHLQSCVFPLRVLRVLGASYLIVTNAAGSLNRNYKAGDVMLIRDHLSLPGLVGLNPLVGPNLRKFGVRFPSLENLYDFDLRKIAAKCYIKNKAFYDSHALELHEGVYGWAIGPDYETQAEWKFFDKLKADVLGMSTVPEVVVARHSGMKVLGFSLVTNTIPVSHLPSAIDQAKQEMEGKMFKEEIQTDINHQEVLETANRSGKALKTLISDVLKSL